MKTLNEYMHDIDTFESNLTQTIQSMNASINGIVKQLQHTFVLSKDQWQQFTNLLKNRETFYLAEIHKYREILEEVSKCIESQTQ